MNTKEAIHIRRIALIFATAAGSLFAQPSSSVLIDAPAPNAALNGTIEFRGWALKTTGVAADAIQSVTVFVDGNQVGTAAPAARPDVCEVFAGRPGCPNVGWFYNLDVDALAPGAHVLKAVALDAAGKSSSSEVSFTATSSPLPSVSIDSPAAGTPISGNFRTSGLSPENSSVTISIDGNQVGTADRGVSGWVYDLDTTSLSPGSHLLKVAALNVAGKTAYSKVNFTVASGPVSLAIIDTPKSRAEWSGKAEIRGRTTKGADPVQSLNVFVDGNAMGTAAYDPARPDAWVYHLDTDTLSPGTHLLKVVAVDTAGNSSASEVRFNAASSAPIPSVIIDTPVSGETFSGIIGLRGWAMEKKGALGFDAVQSVAVFIDGNQVGTATYGTPRPDVCGTFPGRQDCPGVGWTYNLDATFIPEGNHALKVVATDASGRSSSVQSDFLK